MTRKVHLVVLYVPFRHVYYEEFTDDEIKKATSPDYSPLQVSWLIDCIHSDATGVSRTSADSIFITIDPDHYEGIFDLIAHEFGHMLEATLSPHHKTSEAGVYLLTPILAHWAEHTFTPMLKLRHRATPTPNTSKD